MPPSYNALLPWTNYFGQWVAKTPEWLACGSPRRHSRQMFSDGSDDGQRVWPRWPTIMHYRSMVALFLSLIGALRCAL
jgi:hypothetical protein